MAELVIEVIASATTPIISSRSAGSSSLSVSNEILSASIAPATDESMPPLMVVLAVSRMPLVAGVEQLGVPMPTTPPVRWNDETMALVALQVAAPESTESQFSPENEADQAE